MNKKEQKALIGFNEGIQSLIMELFNSKTDNVMVCAELAEASSTLLATASNLLSEESRENFLEKVKQDALNKIKLTNELLNKN
tara:strand:- start:223 stop:471 length:249 start_codon:yes stop_codon:yes gene_type:complete